MQYFDIATRSDLDLGVRVVQVRDAPPCEDVTATLRGHLLGVHVGPSLEVVQRRDGRPWVHTYHPGQLTFVPAGSTLSCTTRATTSFLHVHFGAGFVEEITSSSSDAPPRPCFDDGLIADLSRSLVEPLTAQGPSARLYVESAAVVLWSRLAKGRGEPSRHGLSRKALAEATALLDAHLGEGIGIVDLAHAVGLSARHFARMFKRSTGKSPHRYLHDLRMERAKQLLLSASPSLRIVDVALEVGFSNPSHFAAAFRRATGITPERFRASVATRDPARSASAPGGDRSAH